MIFSDKVAHIYMKNTKKRVHKAFFPLCHLIFSGTNLAHTAHRATCNVCH